MAFALKSVRDLVKRSRLLQKELKRLNFAPDAIKRDSKTYTISEASKLIGRTTESIRQAEDRGDLPEPPKNDQGRRTGYSLSAINYMRERFGTRPALLRTDDDTCVLSVQNFKGGVGKSTIAVHVSEYLARAGYRVLLVDCDSQASATMMFGYTPDQDLDTSDTLLPYFSGKRKNIAYAIKDTYWDGLKLIPSNLSLYGSEYFLASQAQNNSKKFYHWLRDGINEIKKDFDVIIIDPPPALGMISLNVLYAANAVVIPMPPSLMDFASTIQFFQMLEEVLSTIGEDIEYSFVRILISRKRQKASSKGPEGSQDDIIGLCKDFYGNYLMRSIYYDSAEIEKAIAVQKTVYELEGPTGSHKTYKRALEVLDSVGAEIELMVRMTWPSHRRQLEKNGII